jgi:hypothetical protein
MYVPIPTGQLSACQSFKLTENLYSNQAGRNTRRDQESLPEGSAEMASGQEQR